MRFSQYKCINELFASVIEATEYMQKNNNSGFCDACVQCLLSISGAVNEESHTEIKKQIEQLTELYQSEIYCGDELSELLDNIKNQLSEIKYRLRVLFVAELGGKWDAMSSVYDSFINMDDVDVDVVMQPIFREVKLDDGTVRKDLIYDDYLTPLGIKYYHYQKYDIEKIRPDITFISQPYESVTVPVFWPENISKYSKLVYLPYYTALMLNRINYVAYDSFFNMPTQKYSWKIACQSEQMKKAYMRYASERGKNVIVSGLPKWDYPVSLNKENTPCPDGWKKKIKGRTVFLLNTHFNTSSILDIFSRDGIKFFTDIMRRKDIALIWRPHPMTLSIIKVYIPEYLDAYNELLSLIKKSENIIYDDMKPYSYSFVWSDALLSLQFPSSIISQYLLTDKPLTMISFKNDAEDSYIYKYDRELFDFSSVPLISGSSSIMKYMEQIKSGEDRFSDVRKGLAEKYFPLSDGNAGRRFAEAVIRSFHDEFCSEKNQENSFKVLVTGNESESRLCIEELKENNISFDICMEFSENSYSGYNEVSISECEKYKYIIINSEDKADNIREYILRSFDKTSPDNVIDFYREYNNLNPVTVCDRELNSGKNASGIILGTSRVLSGILSSRLKNSFYNFSLKNQCLENQLKTIEYFAEKYPEKLNAIDTVIIDLNDCNYFNVSLSDFAGENKVNEIWNSLFQNVYSRCNAAYPEKTVTDRVTDKMTEEFNYERSAVKNINKEIIQNNIDVFEEILRLIRSINPEIKIYTVTIPLYWETEMKDYRKETMHKEYFENIIKLSAEKYGLKHIDIRDITDISADRNLYADACHLNYFGALKLTSVISDILESDA